MDAIPLELHEQIFEYLVPLYDLKEITTLPTYTKEQRRDIYNIRLTNRRLRTHSTLHFVRIVQDVPTGCTNNSMQKLASLVTMPGVGEKMTCLSLNDFAQVIVQREKEDGDWEFRVVPEWIRESLPEILRNVVSGMPLLHHLVCIMDPPNWPKTSGWDMCKQDSSEESEEESEAWLHKLPSSLQVSRISITVRLDILHGYLTDCF